MAQVFVEEMKMDRWVFIANIISSVSFFFRNFLFATREVYTRECHDAYYRAGTYVAHRIIIELPTTIMATLAFSTILYW